MPLSPDIEARGMKAYEQARAFERLRSWRLPLSYVVFALIPALSGAWMWAKKINNECCSDRCRKARPVVVVARRARTNGRGGEVVDDPSLTRRTTQLVVW